MQISRKCTENYVLLVISFQDVLLPDTCSSRVNILEHWYGGGGQLSIIDMARVPYVLPFN